MKSLLRTVTACIAGLVLLCSPLLAGTAHADWVERRPDGIYWCTSQGCERVIGWNPPG